MLPESIHETPDWYNQRLHDGGPVYMETDLDQYIVEPWNAISSLLIVLPAVYWLFRIGKDYRNYKFLIYAIPLMVLGGTGSTLFHAFRASRFFLLMDFMPQAILTISLTVYFWIKVFRKWWYIFFIIMLSVGLRYLIFSVFELSPFMSINVSYTITGVLVGLPVLILLKRTRYHRLRDVVLTIVFFITAIVFREMDARDIPFLPMGTHFLWHAFTGLGGFYILSYLYHFRTLQLNQPPNDAEKQPGDLRPVRAQGA